MADEVEEDRDPKFRESIEVVLSTPAIEWTVDRPQEVIALRRFVELMIEELAANTSKGDRPGWLQMTRVAAMGEIGWHFAKLQVAAKDLEKRRARAEAGNGALAVNQAYVADAEARVREYSADVANCALMALDVIGLLGVES